MADPLRLKIRKDSYSLYPKKGGLDHQELVTFFLEMIGIYGISMGWSDLYNLTTHWLATAPISLGSCIKRTSIAMALLKHVKDSDLSRYLQSERSQSRLDQSKDKHIDTYNSRYVYIYMQRGVEPNVLFATSSLQLVALLSHLEASPRSTSQNTAWNRWDGDQQIIQRLFLYPSVISSSNFSPMRSDYYFSGNNSHILDAHGHMVIHCRTCIWIYESQKYIHW